MAKLEKATPAQKVIIEAAKKKKYPQMYNEHSAPLYNKKPGLGDRIKLAFGKSAAGKKKAKKPLTTVRTQAITDQLKQAGITESDIAKLRKAKK